VADLANMFRNIYRKLAGDVSPDLLGGEPPKDEGSREQKYI
jgi:hypothetical protein